MLQGLEYYEARFTFADRVYGSTFFIATGFHSSSTMQFIKWIQFNKLSENWNSSIMHRNVRPLFLTWFEFRSMYSIILSAATTNGSDKLFQTDMYQIRVLRSFINGS